MAGVGGRGFLLLLISTLGSFTGFAALLPVVPLWVVSGGAGEFEAGATTGVFMSATVATQFCVPALVRRVGYRPSLLLGTALLGLPAAVFPFTTEIVPVLAASTLRGIGFGMLTVCGSALVALLARPDRLGRAAAVYGVVVGLPTLLAVPAATWLVERIGFLPVFAVATGLPLLAAVPVAFLPALTGVPPTPGGLRSRLGAVRAPWALMVCAASGAGAALTFLPLATGGAAAAIALFALSASTVAGRWLAGRIGDRLGRPGRQLPVATVTTALGMAGIAVGIGADAAWSQLLGATLLGAGFGVVQNDSMVLMFARLGRDGTAFASTAWNVGYDAGTGLGAVLLGAVVSAASYPVGFGVIAAVTVLLLPAALGCARAPAGTAPESLTERAT